MERMQPLLEGGAFCPMGPPAAGNWAVTQEGKARVVLPESEKD